MLGLPTIFSSLLKEEVSLIGLLIDNDVEFWQKMNFPVADDNIE